MGRLLLVGRLAARDLRRRPTEAALLLLAITAATSVLTLGLVLRGVIGKPYESTREATVGPDVVAALFPRTGAAVDRTEVKALTDAPGVVAHSGPYPVVAAVLEANGRTVIAQTEGRDTAAAAVDQPKPTKGGWVRPGGVVLEAAFAEALGVGPGDQVTLAPLEDNAPRGSAVGAGQRARPPFRVAGVAVTAATPPYPEPACLANLARAADTGVVWLTRADALRLAPPKESLIHVLNLKLADPAAATTFAADHNPPESARPARALRAAARAPATVAGDP